MLRYRRRAVVLLVVLTAVLLSLTVYAALRDTTPPQLYVEAPARLPVGASLALFASADEPVTLTLEYAGAPSRSSSRRRRSTSPRPPA